MDVDHPREEDEFLSLHNYLPTYKLMDVKLYFTTFIFNKIRENFEGTNVYNFQLRISFFLCRMIMRKKKLHLSGPSAKTSG